MVAYRLRVCSSSSTSRTRLRTQGVSPRVIRVRVSSLSASSQAPEMGFLMMRMVFSGRGGGKSGEGPQVETLGKRRDENPAPDWFLQEAVGRIAGHHIAQPNGGRVAGAKNHTGGLPVVGLAEFLNLVKRLFSI